MKNSIDEKITYHENSVAVAKNLRERGYTIASSTGIRQREPDRDVIGILKSREPIQKNFLGFKWNKQQRGLYIGTLWLENQARGAIHNENWVLEVYGRDYVPELTKLVKELSEQHQAKVQIILDSEKPRVEIYSLDYETVGIGQTPHPED